MNHQNFEIIKKGIQIRLIEEKLLSLFNEGKLNGTVHTCLGQELIPVCLSKCINSDDYILSNHRGHGHLLSRNDNLNGFFSELMGKKKGLCGGFGGSQHLFTNNHMSNGIQGGMTPIGAGLALSNKIKGNNKIVVCFIGDGTLGEGIIYESFNIASLWNLPIIFILENNKIAQSTTIYQSFSGSIQERATGFGLKYFNTNSWDINNMLNVFSEACESARLNNVACFIEVDTYRLYSHSKGDDNRDENEILHYKEKDIITQTINSGDININIFIEEFKEKINNIVAVVEKQEDLIKLNYYNQNLQKVTFSNIINEKNNKRINELIYDSLKEEFSENINTIMLGEDIEYKTKWTKYPYGGAFKISKDLSNNFKNVMNTPISEAAIVGVGTGLAIGGMKPIVEIMFGDFLTLAFDQLINHACKFHQMFDRKVNIPLIIRTPMGGKRGYGPTHSQSIEKHFLGITDLSIIVLNQFVSPTEIYKNVFKLNNPTLVIENKILYTKYIQSEIPKGFSLLKSNELFPTIKIVPSNKKADITIICYGEIVDEVISAMESAFFEEEIVCEIICQTIINPININPIITSLSATNKLITVEEGTNIASYSSEVVALLCENGVYLKSLARISNNFVIPSSHKAELELIPNSKIILKKIKEIFYE